MIKQLLVIGFAIFVSACTGVAENITPVERFELNRYLGKWYEIARLDHSFERGLDNVTAEYSLRDDGGVTVLNRGYSNENEAWKEAQGKAYFVSSPQVGHLKVSFFGPFYGSYVIFELDHKDYQYAFVTSYNKSYLWLLARKSTVSAEVLKRFKNIAEQQGFAVDDMIYVEHE